MYTSKHHARDAPIALLKCRPNKPVNKMKATRNNTVSKCSVAVGFTFSLKG